MGRKFTFPVAVAAALGALSAGLAAVSTASASIAIGNAGFTTPTVASGSYDAATNSALVGNAWTFTGNPTAGSGGYISDTGIAANGAVVVSGATVLVGAPNGQAGFIEGGNASGSARLTQSVGTLAAGNYTISAQTEAAGLNGNTNLSQTYTNSIEVVLLNTSNFSYTTLGAFTPTSATSFNLNSVSGAVAAGSYLLEFIGTIDTGSPLPPQDEQNATTYLTGIQMSVPEPATLGLLGVGELGLLLIGRRRKQKTNP